MDAANDPLSVLQQYEHSHVDLYRWIKAGVSSAVQIVNHDRMVRCTFCNHCESAFVPLLQFELSNKHRRFTGSLHTLFLDRLPLKCIMSMMI